MAHILAKLTAVKFADVQQKLADDAAAHAEQGMYLEHLWRNAEDANEIFFLFRVNDLSPCRQRINQVHAEARRTDPNAKLPEMIFLADEG